MADRSSGKIAMRDFHSMEILKHEKVLDCDESDKNTGRTNKHSNEFHDCAQEEEDAILRALMIEKGGVQKMRNTTGEQWQKSIHRAKRSRFVYLPSKSRTSEFAIFCPEPFQIPSSKYQTRNCSNQTSGDCSVEDVSTSPDNYSGNGMNPCSDKNDEQQLKKESNLRDVTLTVERHSHEQKVPLVSLTSGLNLSAIIGHPIEVDALDDDDGRRMFWPIWKTSRRTRVCYVQQTHHHPQIARKKPLKKPQSMSIDKVTQYSIGIAEGNIEIKKTENDIPARVTCIPVKVAFGRLLVAVGS